jgi:hypothetical protein
MGTYKGMHSIWSLNGCDTGVDRPLQCGSTSPAWIWELRLPKRWIRWRAADLRVATPRAADLVEGAGPAVHGGENGLAGGLDQKRARRRALGFFFGFLIH